MNYQQAWTVRFMNDSSWRGGAEALWWPAVSGGAAGLTRDARGTVNTALINVQDRWELLSGHKRLNWRLQFWEPVLDSRKKKKKAEAWAPEMAAVQESGGTTRWNRELRLSGWFFGEKWSDRSIPSAALR